MEENKENKENIENLVEDKSNTTELKIKKELVDWGKSIVIAAIFAFLIMRFVFFFAIVPTGSMIPTINEGDRFIVARFFKYFDREHKGLKYGDIVVFNFEEDGKKKLLVKRVIGFAGDKIRIENGIVFRNGEPIQEPYVKNRDSFFMEEMTVADGDILVLGDNRINSYDCRYWEHKGVPLSDIVGEALFVEK